MKLTSMLLASAFLTLPIAVDAQTSDSGVQVRLGSHPGYGRVVFSAANLTGFTIERAGDTAIVHLDGAGLVGGTDRGTHNVTAVQGGDNMAVLVLTPGVRLRSTRMGDRVVVDVLDAGRPLAKGTTAPKVNNAATPMLPSPAAMISAPIPSTPAAQVPDLAQSPLLPAAQALVPAVMAPPGPLPISSPQIPAGIAAPEASPVIALASSAPLGLAATHIELPSGTSGSAVLLPFSAQTGAAAFRRAGMAWIVFDERRPIDLAVLRDDPLLAGATVQLLTSAALIRLPVPDGVSLSLTRQEDGWRVSVTPTALALQPITPVTDSGHLMLPVATPGNVVVVPDPETGQNLLVGTLRGKQAGLPVAYRLPELVLLPSWQGVLVEPLSDEVSLHPTPGGFVLETGGALPPASPATQALNLSASLTRRFDFFSDTSAALLRRLQVEVAQAGAAPPLARSQPRIAAAQTMIALGMGTEAQSLLHLAAEEDPRVAANFDARGLSAIAALLGGREAEATGLDAPELTGTDEVALWRAVRAAQHPESSAEAAPVFSATFPLILSYSKPLRNRLLPLAAETMALYGAPDAADALLALRPDDPRLTYARALRLEAKGETGAALVAYDALAQSRDRLASTRSATRAAELRLASGAITPGVAARLLEGQFLAWRGDNRELDLRLEVAALRAQAGAWRPAFDLLRETVALFPEAAGRINAGSRDLLEKFLNGSAVTDMPAIDLVSLAEENAELVAGAAPAQVTGLLADKLISLDLPRRAAPVLERMMRAAPAGPAQAALGMRLATVRFRAGDDTGAGAALAASNAPGLPLQLLEERVLLGARITAHGGDSGSAAASLAALASPAADDLRATLLTDAREWRGAERAMQDFVDKTIPADGPIDSAQQDTLLRLATAQQRAGDNAALYALGKQAGGRILGPRGDMFRLLTAAPVDSVADIRRASSEIALARSVPTALAALGSK